MNQNTEQKLVLHLMLVKSRFSSHQHLLDLDVLCYNFFYNEMHADVVVIAKYAPE